MKNSLEKFKNIRAADSGGTKVEFRSLPRVTFPALSRTNMLLYVALVRQDNFTKLGNLRDDFTDCRFVCKIKDGLGLKPLQPPFFAVRQIIEAIRQMSMNVHDRSSEDLSKLILDCPVQTRCLSVSYERHVLSEG